MDRDLDGLNRDSPENRGMYASLRDAGAAAKSPRGSLMNRITTVGSPRSALPGHQAAGGLLESPNKVRADGLARRSLKGDGPPQGRGVVVGSPTKGWGMRVPSGGTHRGVALIPQEWPEMPHGPSPSKVIDMRSTWSGMNGPPVVDPEAFKSSKSPSKAAGGGMRSTLGSVDDSGPSPSKVMDARATWGADDIGIMIGLSAVDTSTAHRYVSPSRRGVMVQSSSRVRRKTALPLYWLCNGTKRHTACEYRSVIHELHIFFCSAADARRRFAKI
jgi:hypothetical protein